MTALTVPRRALDRSVVARAEVSRGSTIEAIAKGYTPLVERLGSGGQFMLSLGEGVCCTIR